MATCPPRARRTRSTRHPARGLSGGRGCTPAMSSTLSRLLGQLPRLIYAQKDRTTFVITIALRVPGWAGGEATRWVVPILTLE